MHLPNYNFLAPFYKLISKIVFGDSLEKAATVYFEEMDEKDSVLIIGGGNGDILKNLYAVKSEVTIAYCELSSKFIGLANKKNPYPEGNVLFLNQDALILDKFPYDWVILPFFLDQFSEEDCISFLLKIKQRSKPKTKILFADMHEKGIPKWLLKTMFVFFRVTTKLKRNSLPDFEKVFDESGWKKEREEIFSNGKVVSEIYVKPN